MVKLKTVSFLFFELISIVQTKKNLGLKKLRNGNPNNRV